MAVEIDVKVYAQIGVTQSDSNSAQRSIFKQMGGIDSPFCVSPTRDKRSINAFDVDDSKSISLNGEKPKEHRKRQAHATTSNTRRPLKTAPILNVSDMFYDTLYLSARNSARSLPTTFSFLDLMTWNDSSSLIQDASTNRYLHSYGDVQHNDYGRFQTHVATHMPYDSKLIFWSFAKGYLQLNRGSTG